MYYQYSSLLFELILIIFESLIFYSSQLINLSILLNSIELSIYYYLTINFVCKLLPITKLCLILEFYCTVIKVIIGYLFIINQTKSPMSENDSSSYEKYLICLGGIAGCLCCTYAKVQTSTIGIMQKFGKFKQVCNPGLNYYTPFVQQIKPISLQTRVVDMHKQMVYTKDNMSLHIDTVLFYRIVDAFKATYIVKDILASVMQLTFVTLRTICGQYTLQDILTKRVEVNDKIQQFVRKQSEQWGLYIDHLLLKDLHLSDFLKQNLSKVSKTKRLVESKIISAKADLESAKLYREAADILDMKAAMQIRFLQTLELMQSMKSKKTVIMPLHPTYE